MGDRDAEIAKKYGVSLPAKAVQTPTTSAPAKQALSDAEIAKKYGVSVPRGTEEQPGILANTIKEVMNRKNYSGDAAKAAFPAVGSMIGGTLGTPFGPWGASAAAGLGGGTGEALRQLISGDYDAMNVGKEAAISATGERALRYLGKGALAAETAYGPEIKAGLEKIAENVAPVKDTINKLGKWAAGFGLTNHLLGNASHGIGSLGTAVTIATSPQAINAGKAAVRGGVNVLENNPSLLQPVMQPAIKSTYEQLLKKSQSVYDNLIKESQ